MSRTRKYRGRASRADVAAYIPPHRPDPADEVLAGSGSIANDILDEFDTTGSHLPTWRLSQERIDAEERDMKLYGELLTDVRYLRSRDFTIYAYEHDDGTLEFVCDDKTITADELRAKAARERRLFQEKAAA